MDGIQIEPWGKKRLERAQKSQIQENGRQKQAGQNQNRNQRPVERHARNQAAQETAETRDAKTQEGKKKDFLSPTGKRSGKSQRDQCKDGRVGDMGYIPLPDFYLKGTDFPGLSF